MKPGRNDPCPCGSGKKYKHCCLIADATPAPEELAWRRIRRELEGWPARMLRFALETYGEEALDEAWCEFHLWDEEAGGFDPESPHLPVFMSWFLHLWAPDPEATLVQDVALHGTAPSVTLLERRGARLAPVLREYLTSCTKQSFSFYEIERCDRGRGFALRDVLTGETCEALERSASQQLSAGELLYAQLASAQGVILVEAMGPVAFAPSLKLEVIALRAKMRAEDGTVAPDALRDWDFELRELYLSLTERLLNPTLPELRTTDDEELEPHTLVFEIDSAQHAFEALKHLDTESSDEELLTRAERDGNELRRIELAWTRAGNRIHPNWTSTVLGRIRIEDRRLTVDVHSRPRAESIKVIVAESLGARARLRLDQVQSVEKMLQEQQEAPQWTASSPDLMQLPEVQAAIASHMQRHYEAWIDIPVPALRGRTPRAAVADADGREQVDALLRQMEQDGARVQPPMDPEVWRRVRRELGLPAT